MFLLPVSLFPFSLFPFSYFYFVLSKFERSCVFYMRVNETERQQKKEPKAPKFIHSIVVESHVSSPVKTQGWGKQQCQRQKSVLLKQWLLKIWQMSTSPIRIRNKDVVTCNFPNQLWHVKCQ